MLMGKAELWLSLLKHHLQYDARTDKTNQLPLFNPIESQCVH